MKLRIPDEVAHLQVNPINWVDRKTNILIDWGYSGRVFADATKTTADSAIAQMKEYFGELRTETGTRRGSV